MRGLPSRIALIRLANATIAVYRFPQHPAGGVNGGHVAAFAASHDQIVFASIHGYGHADAAIAMVADLLGVQRGR